MLTRFEWPIRVYIEDTDAGGIVYYVNYLKFMERARTEMLRHYSFGKQYIFEQDIMFVVHSMNVDYKKPARLDDELIATAEVKQSGKTYILFHQQILLNGQLLCAADIKIACVKKKNVKPAAIPKEILATLRPD